MAPPKPQTNFSKKPVRRVRLPKIGPRKTKGLFEEYFYGFLVAIFLVVAVMLRGGGMRAYDAVVLGLWIAAVTWFAWQAKLYYREKSNPLAVKKAAQTVRTTSNPTNGKQPAEMKPMIGPQWAMKTGQKPSSPSPGQPPAARVPTNKPAFVYERPTLPDRKPKLPANWPGRQGKKPKR
jgi:hypothetical protein